MKRYYTLIILGVLLVLASTWIQAGDSLSLFQANLKEEVLTSEQQEISLENNINLKQWIIDKDKKESVTENGEPIEKKKLVRGITFYNNQKELGDTTDFLSEKEVIVKEKTGLQLAISPETLMNTSYQLEQEQQESELTSNLKLKQQLGININHKLSQNLNVKAGYYLTEETEKDMFQLPNKDNWQMSFDSDELMTDNIQKIGINYDTSDHTSVFANYLDEESSTDDESTTVVGVKYNNDSDQIVFQYQIEESEDKKVNSTGVELGINEFTKLKAIYTMIDDNSNDKSTDEVKSESNFEAEVLDLGLNVNVNDDTNVKVGYQLSNNKDDGSEEIWEKLKPHKANIELEVKF